MPHDGLWALLLVCRRPGSNVCLPSESQIATAWKNPQEEFSPWSAVQGKGTPVGKPELHWNQHRHGKGSQNS